MPKGLHPVWGPIPAACSTGAHVQGSGNGAGCSSIQKIQENAGSGREAAHADAVSIKRKKSSVLLKEYLFAFQTKPATTESLLLFFPTQDPESVCPEMLL